MRGHRGSERHDGGLIQSRLTCTTCWLSSSMSAGPSLITLTDSWKVTVFSARCSRGGTSLASSAGRHPFCTAHTHTHTHRKQSRELQGGSVKESRVKTQTHTGLHCSRTVNPLQQQEAAEALATRGQRSPVKGLERVSFLQSIVHKIYHTII